MIVRVADGLFGLPAMTIRSMVALPPIVHVPHTAEYVRGVINLRGDVLALIDLRTRCGMEPLSKRIEETCQMLLQREQDHRNWLAELEKSVEEKRPFTLATDPHKCAFGKWYDAFHTDDLVLAGLLKNFDEPHKAIHGIAARIEHEKQQGRADAAKAIIERTRNQELARMIGIFAEVRGYITKQSREIAVVIDAGQKPFAIAVDKVESAERLDAAAFSDLPAGMTAHGREMVSGIAKRKKDQQMVLLLDVKLLWAPEHKAEVRAA